ncbi:hypothetical protein D046_0954B, partial [Vibrio parahaemolyticus V-223/04]
RAQSLHGQTCHAPQLE